MSKIDILAPEYIEAANEELRHKPCPVCGVMGSASVSRKFIPSESFSLAGAQAKLSGNFCLVLTCRACHVEGRLSQE